MAHALLDADVLPAHMQGLTGDALRAALHGAKKARARTGFAPLPSVSRAEPIAAAPVTEANSISQVRAQALDRLGALVSPEHTLASFVAGECNALAFGMAHAMAKPLKPQHIPPLAFFTSEPGQGKTHLLQAIVAGLSAQGLRAIYIPAEMFVHGSLSTASSPDHGAIAGADCIAIDDAHLIGSKSSVESLYRVLSERIGSGKRVVMAADRAPSDMDHLDATIRSRMGSGIVIPIPSPVYAVRKGIVARQVDRQRADTPEFVFPDEVADFIAANVSSSGRDVVSAVRRVSAHSALTGHDVNLAMAEAAVRDLTRANTVKRPKIEDVQRVVCQYYSLERLDLVSARRTKNIVRPRQCAMYLCKKLTPRSLPEIGRRFGNRDHTTVLHAVRKVEELIEIDNKMADDVAALRRLLEG